MAVLVYGVTGYVGALLLDAAVARGLAVLAGGRSTSVLDVAIAAGVGHRIGGVDDLDLDGVDVVLNAAGPFARTAAPLAKRCVDTGTHYLDIAGEVDELAAVRELDAVAAEAGVMLMPGVGFGVVPTDALALHVASQLAEPVRLDIAFATAGGVSGGTLRTLLGGFGDRGAVTEPGLASRTVSFADGDATCVRNPWRGDLLTAPLSTGVADVVTWTALPAPLRRAMVTAHRRGRRQDPPLATRVLRRLAELAPAGPSQRARDRGSAELWSQATGADGTVAAATLSTPDAYVHTVDAALEVAARAVAGTPTPGFRTPAQEYGVEMALGLPGVVLAAA